MAQYMQLDGGGGGGGGEQLMFFQLPQLLPAPNVKFKSEPGRGDPQLRPAADDEELPPRSLPIHQAPGGLVSVSQLLALNQ